MELTIKDKATKCKSQSAQEDLSGSRCIQKEE